MESSLVADLWWTVQFDILFTFSQLLNLHPYCRIRATKCMQGTIALYQYKLLNLFPFSVIEFCEVVMFKPWTQYVWWKSGIFFFSTLQCEWINILLRTLSIWFLLDHKLLRFSLHLAESVLKEIQKTNAVWLLFYYLLLVARLRFSLVYLRVSFVFSAAALHFLVRWKRLIALWSKGIYIPFLHFFPENNPEPRPVFFRPLVNEDLFFYNKSWHPKHLKIIAEVNEGAKVLDICTTLISLPDLPDCGTYVSLRMSVV